MGAIPNTLVLRNRLSKDELNKEIRRIFDREEGVNDINDPDDPQYEGSAMARLRAAIGRLRQPS